MLKEKCDLLIRALNMEAQLRTEFTTKDLLSNTSYAHFYCREVVNIIRRFELKDKYDADKIIKALASSPDDGVYESVNIINNMRADVDKYQMKEEIIKNEYSIELDDNWKSIVQSYVFHIRDVIRRATISEGIKERILNKIENLSREVERNRTNVERISSIWLDCTEAIGKGAKNLEPAVTLVDRLAKALGKIRGVSQPLTLPPPDLEKLDVPDSEEVE